MAPPMAALIVAVLVTVGTRFAVTSAGTTGDRLVVAEEVNELSMKHNLDFARSKTFTVYKDILFVPSANSPHLGTWQVGKFYPTYIGKVKTRCVFNRAAGYYLPGHQSAELLGKTPAQCEAACCSSDTCISFDYAHTTENATPATWQAQTCWLSDAKEGAGGLAWSPKYYDYYELAIAEGISSILVVDNGVGNEVVLGPASHSGTLYHFQLTGSGAGTSVAPLGPVSVGASGSATAGHSMPILAMKHVKWGTSNFLITGGYDKTVIIWSMTGTTLTVQTRITGFTWPVWAIEPADTQARGIFIAGDHADIVRWAATAPTSSFATTLTAAALAGATTITVAEATFAVGDGITIGGEVAVITAISATTITISTGLRAVAVLGAAVKQIKDRLVGTTYHQDLKMHARLVRCLAYDSGRQLLASGGEDSKIILWRKLPAPNEHDFEYASTLFDHTDTVSRLVFATPSTKSLLISGSDDATVMVFDPTSSDTQCAFDVQRNYYLPGNNRYVFEDSSLAECKRRCCESPWCASFDYDRKGDPNGLHPANTCWLSTNIEGPSGVAWDSTGAYDYYELGKRGSKMLTLSHPGPVQDIAYTAGNSKLIAVERLGDEHNDGGLSFLKLTEVVCPDGSSPNYAGTKCELCRLGFAGRAGACDICPPGKYSPSEGSFACEPCLEGWSSTITEAPSDKMIPDLYGRVKCYECPKWSLKVPGKTGQIFCDWCPPGSFPSEDRATCISMQDGADYNAGRTSWSDSWYRDSTETSDRFCPTAGQHAETKCMYPPAIAAQAVCPMTCPRAYQIEMDGHHNERFHKGGMVAEWDLGWKCMLGSNFGGKAGNAKSYQTQCNKLTCMGAMVSMQDGGWTPGTGANRHDAQKREFCDTNEERSDCTCAEDLRQACIGGVLRQREAQCKAQCDTTWCGYMCQMARKREYTGVFRPDSIENPFTNTKCENNGTSCVAICKNAQRRVTVTRPCGKNDVWDSDRDPSSRPGSRYLVVNDQLCGGMGGSRTQQRDQRAMAQEADLAEVDIANRICRGGLFTNTGNSKVDALYRPHACTGGGVRISAEVGLMISMAFLSLLSLTTQ